MLIKDPDGLTNTLKSIVSAQVMVRYSVQRIAVGLRYDAELVTQVTLDDVPYLIHLCVTVRAGRTPNVKRELTLTDLSEEPGALVGLVAQWTRLRFDDWLHDQAFAGACIHYRDGLFYTSVKHASDAGLWRFLTGVVFGEVRATCDRTASEGNTPMNAACLTLQHRFAAFASQNELRWAKTQTCLS
ncbi:hypothetical protein KKH15_01590 [Patescibacteria group bacterium]|nr:hypothetical protein [Patescibacteria group bacterium]MBU1755182.1 hypothetical protein [Patescibacteria group bacterium]